MLTRQQLKLLEEKIKKRFLVFRNEVAGQKSLTTEELKMLHEAGILRPSVTSFSGDAYALGKIVSAVQDKARVMAYEEIMERAIEVPTTDVEERSIEWANENVGEYIKGIEADMIKNIKTGTIRSMAEALRQVRTGISETIKNRETVSQLETTLRDIIDDKYRDWKRVAFTEMNNSIQNGIHDGIMDKHGADALIYKRPNNDACKYCKRIYLEADGITPRIFKLSDLGQNNIGKKSNDWTAVVDGVHPWCFTSGHLVATKRGNIAIEDVIVGDMVFTHRGRWRKVLRTSKREYDGKLVEIVVNEKTIKSTPDHPYLLGDRWVPAKLLCKGDNLFNVIPEKIMLKKINNKPSFRGQVGEFFSILRRFSIRCVPITTMNLNSNLTVCKSNINVVLKNSLQWLKFKTCFFKTFNKSNFKIRVNSRLFALNSFFNQYRLINLRTSPLTVSGFGDGHSFFDSCFTETKRLGLRGGLWFETKFNQPIFDGCTGGSKCESYTLHRVPRVEQILKFAKVDRFFSHAYTSSAIVEISQSDFSGFVYNLAVEDDESYVCEGILTHNCQCQLNVLPNGFEFKINSDGEAELEFTGLKPKVKDTKKSFAYDENEQQFLYKY